MSRSDRYNFHIMAEKERKENLPKGVFLLSCWLDCKLKVIWSNHLGLGDVDDGSMEDKKAGSLMTVGHIRPGSFQSF